VPADHEDFRSRGAVAQNDDGRSGSRRVLRHDRTIARRSNDPPCLTFA
jgi:hypothetical protein